MNEKELDDIAKAFANKYTPKNSYSINKSDLKFGFKEGVRFILNRLTKDEKARAERFCEHEED